MTSILTPLKIFDASANVAAAREFVTILYRYQDLAWEMTRRDVRDRYKGQALGSLWAIGHPLLLMAVYVFAFAFLFRGRLSPEGEWSEYAVYVLAGLAPWIALQEALGRAPTAVLGNANLVKQIIFPSEILPLKVALGATPTLIVGLCVTVALAVATGVGIGVGLLLLPIVVASQTLALVGLVYVLAGIGVFLRDIKDIVSVLLSIGLFLHPILYAPGTAPAALEAAFYASPFSYLIWCYRDALLYGEITRPEAWILAPVLSTAIFVIGYRCFRMLRPMFGNAL